MESLLGEEFHRQDLIYGRKKKTKQKNRTVMMNLHNRLSNSCCSRQFPSASINSQVCIFFLSIAYIPLFLNIEEFSSEVSVKA